MTTIKHHSRTNSGPPPMTTAVECHLVAEPPLSTYVSRKWMSPIAADEHLLSGGGDLVSYVMLGEGFRMP
jgi:hypothetical protein